MTDFLVTNGRVLTQNDRRAVIDPGAVAVTGDTISAVGPAAELETATDPDRVVDAEGGAIIPGLINTHVHVSDIFLRSAADQDRGLYDWLLNVKQAGTLAMTADEQALAAILYSAESIRSGTTTFVENDTGLDWENLERTRAKLDVYDSLGMRNIYGAGMTDSPADATFQTLYDETTVRNPDVAHPAPDEFVFETATVLDGVQSLLETHHDPDNRQSVWPAPVVLERITPESLREAARLAEVYDVMTTVHVAEAEMQDQGPVSSVEYLRNVGYLGDRALLGHCVQISDRDVRLLAETGTSVAHNVASNMRLATGFAPVAEMLAHGITVGLGTDNAILNDTVNPLSDARLAASAHKGFNRDPGVLPAQQAFDMVTREAAAAIGRGADLGSLEVGKQADIAIVDLDHPHLTPAPDPVHTLVYGLQGFEIETVLCGGEMLMDDRDLLTLDREESELLAAAEKTAAQIVDRVGIQ